MPPSATTTAAQLSPQAETGQGSVVAQQRRPLRGVHMLLAVVATVVMAGGVWFGPTNVKRRGGMQPPPPQQHDRTAVASLTPSAGDETEGVPPSRRRASYPRELSHYSLFQGEMAALTPAEGVIEYQLNTPLFADYSEKQRLIKLPEGTAVGYTPTGPLDCPVGTVIAKTFFYPADARDPDGPRRLVETRILEHRDEGWVGIPYLWNDEQTAASLALTGGEVEVAWVHADGQARENVHLVPNFNDCKRCHATPTMQPLGPQARNLNHGATNSQLVAWTEAGILTGMPDHADVPRLAVWDDPSSGTVDERARAYLDVNCAHCHSEQGPARNSGLHLDAATADPYRLGVFKTPVAAGRGTGGRLYGIVPGKPHESIMHYRLETTNAGEMMPEFGRSLVHVEGLALITEWIEGME